MTRRSGGPNVLPLTSGESARLSRALVEALKAVASGAGESADAVAESLVEESGRLVACPAVSLLLTVPGTNHLVVRRASPLAAANAPHGSVGASIRLERYLSEAVATRRPIACDDFATDRRIGDETRRSMPGVASLVVAPLFGPGVEGTLVGILLLAWTTPRLLEAEEMLALEALSGYGGIAIHTEQVLQRARTLNQQLEVVFEAANDPIFLVAPDGAILRANGAARTWSVLHLGRAPVTFGELLDLAQPHRIETSSPPDAVAHALAGRAMTDEVEIRTQSGEIRYVHISAAPIAGEKEVSGAIIIARDITELRGRISEAARLDGAVKTARRVSHELNNRLSLVVGYGELLTTLVEGPASELAERIQTGAMRAGETLHLLQRIIRFEEVEFGGQVMLDLMASTSETGGDPGSGEVAAE